MTENTLKKLAQLLEQDQFELIFPEKSQENFTDQTDKKYREQDIRLVYLMNDAVESFLVFKDARMTGEYHAEYEGELEASLTKQGKEFVLVVKQGDTVVTLFFEEMSLEVHLYEYAYTGHFWVKKYEYLRQLEYRLAILRDKYDYLGPEYCTEEEQKLAALVEFPPLNYCCYPAVPEKYIVPRKNPWKPSKEAIDLMKEFASECEDAGFQKILHLYEKHPSRFWAKRIADMLHRAKHRELVEMLTQKIQEATVKYPRRFLGETMEKQYKKTLETVKIKQARLTEQGYHVDILREEPFTIAKDSLGYKLYLMIWKEKKGNLITEIEEYICE